MTQVLSSCWLQDAPVVDKLAIEEHLVLSATAPWVDTPDLLLLHHNGRRWVLLACAEPSASHLSCHYHGNHL